MVWEESEEVDLEDGEDGDEEDIYVVPTRRRGCLGDCPCVRPVGQGTSKCGCADHGCSDLCLCDKALCRHVEDVPEDEGVVQKIVSHGVNDDGILVFKTAYRGCYKMTWQPACNFIDSDGVQNEVFLQYCTDNNVDINQGSL